MQDLLKLFPDLAMGRQSSSNTDDIPLASSAVAATTASQAAPLQGGTSASTAAPANGTTTNISGLTFSTSPTSAQPAGTSPVAALSSGSSTSPVTPSVNPATGGSSNAAGAPTPPETFLGAAATAPEFDGILVSWNPKTMAQERANARAAFGLGLQETIHTRAMQAAGAGPLEWLTLPPGRSAEELIQQLSQQPGVEFAEKNWVLQTQATSNDPAVTGGNLWGMYGESSRESLDNTGWASA